ncbi:MAG: type II toxin-antitoxin system prevent-host-death family antitoxin [Actinomycetota bacterium]|nr:type II toxin-antitoxin system prevent-host-death family antitoxin [Actinomycetota bacterium]
MRTISQREFRNKSAEVLRDLERGDSFILTNNGRPVGKLTPAGLPDPELRPSRPAVRRGGFTVPARRPKESTATALGDLRGER